MALQARLKKPAEKEKVAADKEAEREEKKNKKELEKAARQERRTSTGSNKSVKARRLARGTRAEISEDDPSCLKGTRFPAIQSFGENH